MSSVVNIGSYKKRDPIARKRWYQNRKNKSKIVPEKIHCKKCNEEKSVSEFYKNCTSSTGFQNKCKNCVSNTSKVKYRSSEKYRQFKIKKATERNRKSKYGVTPEIFQAILSAQDHRCAICESHLNGSKFSLKGQMDHCHTTGKLRGILCGQCNTSLGNFKDSEKILLSAINYLRKYR